jgi:hypothetical protein
MIAPIDGQLFLPEEQGLHRASNPAEFWQHTSVSSFSSHVSTYCSHGSSLNEPNPVARLDCGEGQMRVRTCPVQ